MKPFIPQALPIRTIDWKDLIKDLGPANRALAQFNGALIGLRNPEVLLSPLTANEAVLSSRIEGTQATLDEVLKYEAGEVPEREERLVDIQEILNYQNALRRAEDELVTRPFNLNLLFELHSILLDSVRGRDKGRGRLRAEQTGLADLDRRYRLLNSYRPSRSQFRLTFRIGRSITTRIQRTRSCSLR